MKSISRYLCAATLAACSFVVPVAQAQQPPADMDMKAMMKQGNDKMLSMPMTGNQDVDFAMMMREHHMGALMMAEAELKSGKDAGMRSMARKIIAGQKKEIAQFDAFLSKSGHAGGKGHAGRATPSK